jgi:hypothetical protein
MSSDFIPEEDSMRVSGRTVFALGACVFLLFAGILAGAQQLGITSVESQASFGLFLDALDAAANVSDGGPQPTFSKLMSNYFFGSLTNPIDLTTGAFTGVPLILGYYGAGTKPSSIFGELIASTSATGRTNGTVVNATTNKAGPAGTTYQYNSNITDTENVFLQAYNSTVAAQYLTKLGAMNIGAFLSANYAQNASGNIANWANGNRTQTTTVYYDTAAAGLQPTPTVDFTDTTVATFPDIQWDAQVGVPLFFKTGSIGIMVVPQVGYTSRDLSRSTKETLTVPQGAPGFGPTTPTNTSTTDVTGTINGAVDSTLYFPTLVKGSADNLFLVNLNGTLDVYTAANRVVSTTLFSESATGAGAAITTAAGGTNSTTTATRAGSVQYTVAPSAQQIVYFSLGAGATWAIGPTLNLGLNFTPTNTTYNTKTVTVLSTDGNGNQTFTDAADTILTTTTTLHHNNDGGTWDVITGINLPSSIVFQIGGGPLSLIVGGEVGFSHTLGIVTTATTTQDVATQTTDGTGAVIAPAANTTVAGASYSNTSYSSSWSWTADYALGLSFSLPGDGRIDMLVRNNPNITLSVQGVIPVK